MQSKSAKKKDNEFVSIIPWWHQRRWHYTMNWSTQHCLCRNHGLSQGIKKHSLNWVIEDVTIILNDKPTLLLLCRVLLFFFFFLLGTRGSLQGYSNSFHSYIINIHIYKCIDELYFISTCTQTVDFATWDNIAGHLITLTHTPTHTKSEY